MAMATATKMKMEIVNLLALIFTDSKFPKYHYKILYICISVYIFHNFYRERLKTLDRKM